MKQYNWKKTFSLLLAAVMMLALLAGCNPGNGENGDGTPWDGDAYNDTENDVTFMDAPNAGDEVGGIGLQTVIIEVEGAAPVLWEEFFYDLWTAAAMIMQFEAVEDWDAPFEFNPFDEPMTYNEFAIRQATQAALDRRTIEILYNEVGAQWEDNFDEMRAAQMEMQDWSDEEFVGFLWEHHRITESAFVHVNAAMGRRTATLQALYGEEGELTSDAAVSAYVEENGIVRAKHILFSTDEERDARDAATAGSRAAETHEYLQTLSGDELHARFVEMMEEHGEDPGMEMNPDGYVFGDGVMTPAFYEGTLALNVGEMSAPIPTEFGYHIILRLPIAPDDHIMGGPFGPGGPLRQSAALFDLDRQLEVIKGNLQYTFTAYFAQIIPGVIIEAEMLQTQENAQMTDEAEMQTQESDQMTD